MATDKKFICGGSKYTFGSETISLPISLKGLPPTIEIEGHHLFLKSSFHISLVPIGKLTERFGIRDDTFKDSILNDFCNFVIENEVSLSKYLDEFRLVTQGERISVVLMAEVSNLGSFFDLIKTKYKLTVEIPPTHVTLYTLQYDRGIFIVDSKDLNQLTKVIENPIGSLMSISNRH